jgi:hypothetical protein
MKDERPGTAGASTVCNCSFPMTVDGGLEDRDPEF